VIWEWVWGIYVHLVRSDVPNIIQVASGFVALWAVRKINCMTKRCPRIGRHLVKGTTYHTCGKHTTAEQHTKLHAMHAWRRPDQHKFLNPGVADSSDPVLH
jgi:hypothetical protein